METRIAAYAVIVRDGTLLLSHWTEGDQWTLPGGGLEPGEDPQHAVLREVLEETGYTVSVDALLGIDSLVIAAADRIRGSGDLHSFQVIYAATIIAGKLTDERDGSSDRAAWFALNNIDVMQRVHHVDVGVKLAGY